MFHQKASPAIVVPGISVQPLNRLPRVHTSFDESFLQKLLADHPELLPVRDIRDDIGSLLCIGREVPVSSGSIDNLYLSTSGYPVIVETKLWRNPQARREVLSQTLDYVKEVVRKDFEWFEEQWELFSKQRGKHSGDLLSHLDELSEDDIDEQFLVDRVNRALSGGDVIAMIVVDGIETRLQELVHHLCKDSSHLRYSLSLVELACYEMRQGENDAILVVPRTVQDIEPVQRAYVRVDVAESLKKQVMVTPEVIPEPSENKTPRVSLNEEDFLASIEKSAGRKCRDQIKEFYTGLTESFPLEAKFKTATLVLKIPYPDGDGPSVTVLALEKQGRVYNIKGMRPRLKKWGIHPETVDRLTKTFWTSLHKIDARFDPEGIHHLNSNQFVPFGEIADKLSEVKECVAKAVSEIQEAYENNQ